MHALNPTQILDSLQRYLAKSLTTGGLALDKSQSDGRLNSQVNERQISQALQLYAVANEDSGLS